MSAKGENTVKSVKRLIRIGAAAATLTVLPLVALAPEAAASTGATGARQAAPADEPSGGAVFVGDGVRIRSCPSTGCGVKGLGYRSHFVGWYCGEVQNGFAHIYDFTTKVDGWAATQYLSYYCD
ncbi:MULTISPECIES: SH3 domain-containing protein [Streptomyces]|uniref:SH3 domain-containing protein n=1 Tax=Streptomyces TaxID=1883 RepID=UPI0031F0522F